MYLKKILQKLNFNCKWYVFFPVIKRIRFFVSIFLVSTHIAKLKIRTKNGGQCAFLRYGAF